MIIRFRARFATALLAVTATMLSTGAAPSGPGNAGRSGLFVAGAEQIGPFAPFVFDGDLRDLPIVDGWQPGEPIVDISDKDGRAIPPTAPANPRSSPLDPLVGRQKPYDLRSATPAAALGPTENNFDGIDFQGVNPSDPVMDVGPRYVIAATNGNNDTVLGSVFVVHDKVTGALVAGPSLMASLTIGSVAPACVAGFSDPIVMYDEIADRWMMAEISAEANNIVCMYVSMTDDPIAGGWTGYAITTPALPDYPKFGIWRDGYYMTTNENIADGSAIYAFDRTAIEAGLPLVGQRTIPAPPSLAGFGFQAFTPADLDGGTPPPAGAPNYLVRHRDDEVHNPGSNDPTHDFIEIWEYHVDFAVPANTTLSGPFNVAVSEFSSELCGLSAFECFRQPGTSTLLDPIREVMMFRWAYRNFGTHETLLGNLVTDVGDSTDHGGVRWIELRRTTGDWELYQEGTFAPDADDRWIGASAMDGDGNIAVSYSVSSENTHPALRYTGRLASDPLGVMTQGEFSIIESSASNTSNRWGDYADTVVDPEDDCTFWTTNNYINPNGKWHTRVASFRFATCGDVDTDLDGIVDRLDNCTLVANPSQCDTNGDLFGNHCDADLDNNGIVNQIDLGILRNAYGATGPNDADLDCNQVVNQIDLGRMRGAQGQAPGPSGLVP